MSKKDYFQVNKKLINALKVNMIIKYPTIKQMKVQDVVHKKVLLMCFSIVYTFFPASKKVQCTLTCLLRGAFQS